MSIRLDHEKIENYHFPVNVTLAQTLLGKLLTHIEAMGLPERAEKANKDLIRQTFWKWWADVQENSTTSWKGCIAPILDLKDPKTSDQKPGYYWLTEVGMVDRAIRYGDQLKAMRS